MLMNPMVENQKSALEQEKKDFKIKGGSLRNRLDSPT